MGDFGGMILDRVRFRECIVSIESLLRGQLVKFMLIMIIKYTIIVC